MLLMKHHHLGVAVQAMDKAIACYQNILAYRVLSGPFDDHVQRVSVCFVGTGSPGEIPFELVAPLGDNSPIDNIVKKGVATYHICYEVDDIESALGYLREKNCRIVSEPTPAVAFSGRRIAWLYLPTHQLIELLEQGTA